MKITNFNLFVILLKNKLFQEFSFYTSARYLSFGLELIKGVIIARALGPNIFGLWGIITLIVQYGEYLHLGSLFHGDREIPQLLVTDKFKATRMVHQILGIYLTSLIVIFILVFSFVILHGKNVFYLIELILISLFLIIVQIARRTIFTWLRARKKLFLIGWSLITYSFFSLITLFLLITTFKLWGIVFARLFGLIIGIMVVFRSLKPLFSIIPFDMKSMVEIVKKSFSLLIYNSSFFLQQSISRICLASLLPLEQMGFYSFAFFVSNALIISSQGIYALVFPRVMEKVAKKSDPSKFAKQLSDAGISLIFTFSVVSMLLFIALQPIIVPQYSEAIFPTVFLIGGVALTGPAFGASIIIISKYKENLMTYANILLTAIIGIGTILVIRRGYGLVSIAALDMISKFIFSVFVLFLIQQSKYSLLFRTFKAVSSLFPTIIGFILILASLGLLQFRFLSPQYAWPIIIMVSIVVVILVAYPSFKRLVSYAAQRKNS